jgi:hypothetical protein
MVERGAGPQDAGKLARNVWNRTFAEAIAEPGG